MKKINLYLMTIAAAAMTMSCADNAEPVTVLEGEWNVTEVAAVAVPAETGAVLGFDLEEMNVYGSTGCNRLMAKLVADAEKAGEVAVTDIATTRKMCPDMTVEQNLVNSLAAVVSYKTVKEDANALQLCDKDGKAVIVLAKRTAEEKAMELDGEWNVVAINGNVVEAEELPFLGFDIKGNKVFGFAGCNNLTGELSLDVENGTIDFGKTGATKMACHDMAVEDAFLAALAKVAGYNVENGAMALLDAEGNVVLNLERK